MRSCVAQDRVERQLRLSKVPAGVIGWAFGTLLVLAAVYCLVRTLGELERLEDEEAQRIALRS